MPTKPLHSHVDSLGKAFVEVRTREATFRVLSNSRQAKRTKVCATVLTGLHSSQRKLLLLQLFCQGQANDLHEGANHSNIDGLRMNVQRDLARAPISNPVYIV